MRETGIEINNHLRTVLKNYKTKNFSLQKGLSQNTLPVYTQVKFKPQALSITQ